MCFMAHQKLQKGPKYYPKSTPEDVIEETKRAICEHTDFITSF